MSYGEIWDLLTLGRLRRRRRVARLVRRNERRPDPWGEGPPPDRGSSLRGIRGVGVVVGGVLVALLVMDQHGGVGSFADAGQPGLADFGSYRFMDHQPTRPGVPVTYSSCKPIAVVLNETAAPPGATELVEAALREIHEASGLRFVVEGRSSALPFVTGGTWNGVDRPPVLIAWLTPEQEPRLDGSVVGVGGSGFIADPVSGNRVYVTGGIALDTPSLTGMLGRPGGAAAVTGVVAHELGHVVGLDHVDDKDELMNPQGRWDGRLGPGDRRGLARLGHGPCTS